VSELNIFEAHADHALECHADNRTPVPSKVGIKARQGRNTIRLLLTSEGLKCHQLCLNFLASKIIYGFRAFDLAPSKMGKTAVAPI